MNNIAQRKDGFVNFELIIIILVLLVAGVMAWLVYNHTTPSKPSLPVSAKNQTVNTSTTANNVSVPPQIQTSKDLNAAVQTLNQNDPNTSNSNDLNQLTSETNDF